VKLVGHIRDKATLEVRHAEFEMPDYAMAKAAIEAVVGEGEQLILLRRVTEYTDEG
jgi:hypothetical protein